MFDSNWDLINGKDAHEIEVLNQSSVANVIEALVRYLQHHDQSDEVACSLCPDQFILQELHRTGTLLLLAYPGRYRECEVRVGRRDGAIFDPPPSSEVLELMAEFDATLRTMWPGSSPVEVAAYALWRINWVHPFKNGNGRTARAFAYTCICLKFGQMLPGSVTIIDLITRSRDDYEAALHHADMTYQSSGIPDLLPLQSYVDKLLREQLLSAINAKTSALVANSNTDPS